MEKLIISTSPHLQSKVTTQSVMRDVLIALVPATVAAIVLFGIKAALIVLVSVASAVLAEALFCIICKRPQTAGDLSAAVTGLLLALNVPAKT
ncbi:MAG: RnfABCDGE type electron transport complex subunit D, partial [Clostridia bacterium]|nr:RnfABCDGE type electron transport complex subunit D [Clostridia bacterium]